MPAPRTEVTEIVTGLATMGFPSIGRALEVRPRNFLNVLERHYEDLHESFAAGLESAHVLTLTTTFDNGAAIEVHGIFTYRINDAGKLTNLRGYWSLEDAKSVQSS